MQNNKEDVEIMDYKELLVKYMASVWTNEGITFVEPFYLNRFSDGPKFIDGEINELIKIDQEVMERYNK